MKRSVKERYAVGTEHNGVMEAVVWCDTLSEARKEAKEIREECETLEEKSEVLILKILHI